jgi:hypothetical protein
MLARHAPQRSHGLHLPAMSSTNDSLDLGAIPRARRLLSDSSQLSDAPLTDDDDDASFSDPHDPLADLSLSELSIDPALAARKRKPKFSLFAPRDASAAPAAAASTIEEDDEEDDDDDDVPDVTVRENDRDNDAPDPTIRNAARPRADARPAIGRDDALALDLENARRLNARLRAYHAVLQQTLASRQVRPGRAPPPSLPPTRANAHAPRSTSSRRPRRRTRSSTATSA